jgi:antitoxin (DNA-binding transcriptional repressor) of toxin-antitoxin stability system
MRTIEVSTASKPLADYAREVGEEIIVLTDNDKPIAALVSLENVDRESLSLSVNPQFMSIIKKAEEEFKAGKKLSFDEMKRAVLDEEQEGLIN